MCDHSAESAGPTYIAILLPSPGIAPASGMLVPESRSFGPFDEASSPSPWRAARNFVEENLHLSEGDTGRWVICEITPAPRGLVA